MKPYSVLQNLNCDNSKYLTENESEDRVVDLSMSEYLEGATGAGANKSSASFIEKIIKHREVLANQQVKKLEKKEITKHREVLEKKDNLNLKMINHQKESNGVGEKMKFTDQTDNAIRNGNDFRQNLKNGSNGDSFSDKLGLNGSLEDSIGEKRKLSEMLEDEELNESTEVLSTRPSDVEDTDNVGKDSSFSEKDCNGTSDSSDCDHDSNSDSGEETDDSWIDAWEDSLESLESRARQWQASALKLSFKIFDKPATSWKTSSSMPSEVKSTPTEEKVDPSEEKADPSEEKVDPPKEKVDPPEEKVGLKFQKFSKVEELFSIRNLSTNSFKFHSNLTLHSEDPIFEQKIAVLQEIQEKPRFVIHSCDLCPRGFTKKNQLKIHMKTHTGAIKPFQCEDCCERFKVNLELTEPFTPMFQSEMLRKTSAPPSSYPGFYKLSGPMPRVLTNQNIKLAEDEFRVGTLLGEGGFAKVYSALWVGGPEECRDAVLKVQLGGSPDWEWYITNQVQSRIGEGHHPHLGPGTKWLEGYMQTPSCYVYNTGHILVSQQQHHGTLLDIINLIKDMDKKVSVEVAEPLAIYLIAELLGLIEYLHSVDIIHADIKPDNFMVRFIPDRYNLHSTPCVQLIDFGKSLDLRLLPENTVFDEVLVDTDLLKCVEMREGRPWMHHIDFFGLAGIAHCLLFGGYINNNIVKIGGRWGIKGAAYKRWWQVEWKQFFDDFLNVKGAGKECLPSLVEWRNKLLAVFKEKNMDQQLADLEEQLETAKRGRMDAIQVQNKTPAKKRKKK